MTDKKTILPADPDDLICDTCGDRYPYRGDLYRTFEAARVRGWHIYQNVTVVHIRSTGEEDVKLDQRILCPACIGTPRTREPAPPVLEGQADILEDLDIQVTPVEREKKRRDAS